MGRSTTMRFFNNVLRKTGGPDLCKMYVFHITISRPLSQLENIACIGPLAFPTLSEGALCWYRHDLPTE